MPKRAGKTRWREGGVSWAERSEGEGWSEKIGGAEPDSVRCRGARQSREKRGEAGEGAMGRREREWRRGGDEKALPTGPAGWAGWTGPSEGGRERESICSVAGQDRWGDSAPFSFSIHGRTLEGYGEGHGQSLFPSLSRPPSAHTCTHTLPRPSPPHG